MDRLIGIDAAMVEMESPTMHLHVVGVIVLDGSMAGPALFDRVASLFAERLHLIGPFRRRLVEVPAGLDHPRWIADDDFELDRHLHHRDLGPDAGRDELASFVGEFASTPLLRDRPLWESWLLDGFADESVALVTKVHHALMDGSAGSDLMASLFDLEAEPAPGAAPPSWEGEASPGTSRLLLDAFPAAARRVASAPGVVFRTLGALAGSAREVAQRPDSIAGIAPRSVFNGALTARRSVAMRRCSLDDLKFVRRVLGTTINDVVLAATTASLRGVLIGRGEPVDRPLVASVPVAGSRDSSDDGFGNRTSNMMVKLPVQLDDPGERLAAIHEDSMGAKAAHHALGPEVLDEWATLLPASVLEAGSRAYSKLRLGRLHPPLFNAIVSNVPGPSIPLYLAGARVLAIYPMGPLIANTALNLTVLSHTSELDVGVITCPDIVDDVAMIADGFVDGVAELVKIARQADKSATSRKRARRSS